MKKHADVIKHAFGHFKTLGYGWNMKYVVEWDGKQSEIGGQE